MKSSARLLGSVLLLTLLAAAGCAQYSGRAGVPPPPRAPVAAASAVPGGLAEPAKQPGGQDGPLAQVRPPRKLIQKATLVLQVEDVQRSFARVRELATEAGGYVSASTLTEATAEERSATLELRIPADRLPSSLQQIMQVGRVRSSSEGGEDVTEQYVDMDSRVRNLQREEERLLELLRHADRVKDLLEVEREVARVRGEIELVQGRLKHIDQLVAYATVSVSLSANPLVVPAVPTSFWNLGETVASAWYATLLILRFLAQVAIYALFMLPFGLMLWLIFRLLASKRPPPQKD